MSKMDLRLVPASARLGIAYAVVTWAAMLTIASVAKAADRPAGPPDPREPKGESSWRLVVSRRAFNTPIPLVSPRPDAQGRVQASIIQDTVDALKKQYPGCQILRPDPNPDLTQDLTNLGEYRVGMIVYRFTKNAETKFVQDAIIQANDQLYYLVALTTPTNTRAQPENAELKDNPNLPAPPDARADENEKEDPLERQAYETFRAVLDSVRLLDRTAIRNDQEQRLNSARSWLVNLKNAQKLNNTLIPEQWNLIKRDGKHVGWQYIVEQIDRKAAQDGIKVGIRTRITAGGKEKPFPLEESEAWFFSTIDRNHEDWTKQTAIDDGEQHTAAHPWKKFTEIGSNDMKYKRTAVVPTRIDPEHPERDLPLRPEDAFRRGVLGDANQPWVDTRSSQELDVRYAGSVTDIDAVTRPVPPFYLPQAMASMLPRLLPPKEPKKYAIACYVSEMHEVMLRYIDVGQQQNVVLDGRKMLAVPISDRVGYEGAPTIHYVDINGQYLGSFRGPAASPALPANTVARPAPKPVVGPARDNPLNIVLGKEFVSASGAIALCPPANARALREIGKDDIVEFVEGTAEAPPKESTITILPSDARTVLELWPDAKLERPAEIQTGPAADAGPDRLLPVPSRGAAGPLINPVTPGG